MSEEKNSGLFSEIYEQVGFNQLYNLGYKPNEIKEMIKEILQPYFKNKTILNSNIFSGIIAEAINILKIRKNKKFFYPLEQCLMQYHAALKKESHKCFEACANWYEPAIVSFSKIWSYKKLEHNKNKLENEEYMEECFDLIGKLIEGVIKPFLQCLYCQFLIANSRFFTFKQIELLDLGKIVNDLSKDPKFFIIFNPTPWNISINQWRNISYHHSYHLINSMIICKCGKGVNSKEFQLKKDQLLDVVKTIYEIVRILRTAYNLFTIDFIHEISFPKSNISLKFESELTIFSLGLYSQGFKVISLIHKEDEAILIIKDLLQADLNQRRIHASQFLFNLYELTNSRRLIIEYRDFYNDKDFIVAVDSNICEKIVNNELPFFKLAEKFEILFIRAPPK